VRPILLSCLPPSRRIAMRTPFIAACLLPAFALAAELPAADPASVIFLSKNTNRNQVHYGVQLDDRCQPEGNNPVLAYWRMLELGTEVTEGLKLWERPGYGVRQPKSIARSGEGGNFLFAIRGVPDQEIRLETFSTPAGCRARALTTIAGQEAVFQRIEIEVSGWANIHKVEIFGVATATGLGVSEITHAD
jgi:hypothetical protein